MKLLSLRINNFRQFYGPSPKIEFAHGDRNVTVIHGCNGAGKTAFLNAFTWTLFDSLTPGFLLPDQLVNKRALREATEGSTVEAWVEIEFEHNERKYIVKRTVASKPISGEPGYIIQEPQNPVLKWAGTDGRWHNEESVYEAIGRILPPDLHSYFFFDGERIERIVQPSKEQKEEIGDATKKLLGVEIFLRAETHLTKVRRDLEKELREIGDSKTTMLLEQKQDKEQELEEVEGRQEEIIKNVVAHKNIIKEIEERLRQHKESEAIQKQRDRLNNDKDARIISLAEGRRNLASTISTSGYSIFLQDSSQKFLELVKSLQDRDLLPADIKLQFLDKLLDREHCICARDLKIDTDPRRAVETWKLKAGQSDVESKTIRMEGEIKKIVGDVPTIFERLDQIQQKRESDRKELSRIETELDDIKDKLKNSPREEERSLQLKLDDLNDQIQRLFLEQGENRQQISDLNEEIDQLDQTINKHKTAEEKQRIAQERVSAAGDAIKRIAEMRNLFEADFRVKLQKEISKLFSTISPTPYVPELGNDYSLRLLESAGGTSLPVASSQGENQILSLAFIGSIINVARKRYGKNDGLPTSDTSTYPIVMDSPFGSLDSIYRYQIAEHLPSLADQALVLVSKTQWRGEVEQSMANRIGRSYILTYYSPKKDAQLDSIEINGINCDLIKNSPNDFEYTEIREVPHG